MKTQYIIVSLLIFVSVDISAQVRLVGSNSLRIGSGETDNNGVLIERKRYLEEIANARLFYEGITLGLRYELSDPSEVGKNFQGLRRRWISYKKDGIELQAGHTYALYGRGLTLNLFESRPLNYDSWIDGVSGQYDHSFSDIDMQPNVSVRAIAGNLDFIDIVDSTRPPQNIKLQAGGGTFGLFNKKLQIGASFLQAFVNETRQTPFGDRLTIREVNQPEIYLSFITSKFEGFIGFTEMRTKLTQVLGTRDSSFNKGQGVYASLSYAGESFGITADYKDYRYFVHKPGAYNENYLGKLPISSPPEVYKEFTYTTITRTTHSVNFNDEVGFQIEANINSFNNIAITLNAAASSRHNGYAFLSDTDRSTSPLGAISIIPEFNNTAYYPFWEVFGEFEYEFGELDYIKFFGHRRSDVIVFNGIDAEMKRSTTFGLKLQYQTTSNQSLLTSIEFQDMYDDQRHSNDHKLTNILIMGQYSINPIITFGGQYDFSTWYEQSKHIWGLGFASIRIGSAHTFLISYGSERGGLNCSGGVCRVVPSFSGLRIGLTSQL